MNSRFPRTALPVRRLLAASAFVLFALRAAPSAAASSAIAVGQSGAWRTSFPQNFYGDNAQERGSFGWDPSQEDLGKNSDGQTFQAALGSLNLGLIRFPCGTGANYWNWTTGKFFTSYGTSQNNLYPSKLPELATEVAESGAVPVYVLNLLTDPATNSTYVPPQPAPPAFNVNDYPLKQQLNLSTGLIVTGWNYHPALNLQYFELGNEYYFGAASSPNGDYPKVYKNGSVYGSVASGWAESIEAGYGSSVQCAAVAAFDYAGRPQSWNAGLFSTLSTYRNPGAVTIHVYATPNLPPAAVAPLGQNDPNNSSVNLAQDLIGSAFLAWTKMNDFDFQGISGPDGSATGQQIPVGTNVWITEYNVDNHYTDPSTGNVVSYYYGSWAHGLTLAAMSLKLLEPVYNANDGQNDRWAMTMLIHHDAVGDAGYGDIFETTSAFSNVDIANNGGGWPSAPATEQWGLSASGLASQQINTAAKGQTAAQELTFAGNPQYSVADYVDGSATNITVPALYGWEFAGNGDQAVILNLDRQSHTVNLSGIVAQITSFIQIGGTAADYVTDAYVAGGTKNPVAYDYTGTLQPTGMTTSDQIPSSLTAVVLPAFSLTRITFTPTSNNQP